MAMNAIKDPLTGIRNKRAYDAGIAELDDEMKSSGGAFGIAVVDINDLKEINDRYGHDAGNATIIQMSSIICEVFKHSPVFRYGGDEFTVILQHHDLDCIEELDKRFHDQMNALMNSEGKDPWLRHTAAIGYAVYDPNVDDGADSVFERADKAMYIDKERWKG
jgi:diguanylate cyclase (GGDEF)-like protein